MDWHTKRRRLADWFHLTVENRLLMQLTLQTWHQLTTTCLHRCGTHFCRNEKEKKGVDEQFKAKLENVFGAGPTSCYKDGECKASNDAYLKQNVW